MSVAELLGNLVDADLRAHRVFVDAGRTRNANRADQFLACKDGQPALQRGDLLAEIQGGLTWLDMECNRLFNHDFADCSEAQQKQILDRIAYPAKAAPQDANAVAFFNHLRDLVVSGFFSSKMGVKDLPYLGNTMVADWEGCPPEVLSKLGL